MTLGPLRPLRPFTVGYWWTRSCKSTFTNFYLKDRTWSDNDNNMYLGPVVAAQQVLDPLPQNSHLWKEKKGGHIRYNQVFRSLIPGSVAGQPPSLDRCHFCTPRLVAESYKCDERCRPSSQRPRYPTLYRHLKGRLGRSLRSKFYQGSVVKPSKKATHKCSRVEGCLTGPSTSHPLCLVSRSGQLQEQGFSVEVAERIAALQWSPTRTIYKSKWALFEKWCRENSVDFSSPSVKQISDFLMYLYQDLNRRPSTIDGYRTAIVDRQFKEDRTLCPV